MNRYPLWKNILVVVALIVGFLYTLPNFFGESPAVQVSSVKTAIKVDTRLLSHIESLLQSAGIRNEGLFADANSIRVRFADTDTQLKARDLIEKDLNPNSDEASYSVALNLLSSSPSWLTAIHALPMYLGLDLRGGVHFLLQVDMKGAVTKRLDSTAADLRSLLRDKNLRHTGIAREGDHISIGFADADTRDKAKSLLAEKQPELQFAELSDGSSYKLVGTLKPSAQLSIQEAAISQNTSTLHNRINELGVAEPVIQQQGADRIVVQLPGVQDTAKAKELLGRTATLEVHMVDEDAALSTTPVPGTDLVPERRRDGTVVPVAIKKTVILTGDRFIGAHATYDENHRAAVSVELDAAGGRIMRDLTRDNVGKMMAILLIEKNKPEAISVAKINGEFGNRFQITGMFSPEETNTLAILIRSGSLAAPMEIIEERTIGPSMGAENISKGFHSTLWGFTAIAVFMMIYYMLFGLVSVCALSANLLFLVALLSLMQATLTLPGIAAIALTLGMAIDSNVLINERIREELRSGESPQTAIRAGYEHAWATILDSNVTTLIVGIALLTCSGPVRGFAVVHCLGIMTSIFSSVVVSRALINLIYGRRRKLEKLAIGQVWAEGIKTR